MSALPTTIRASSVAAMLGLDPRKSPLSLFHELRGITGFADPEESEAKDPSGVSDEDASDDPILEGRLFEDAVAQVVRRKFRLTVSDPEESRELRDRHLVGHRDRMFQEDGRDGVLEVKNPFVRSAEYGEPGTDQVPRRHWVQTQTYQGLHKRAASAWTPSPKIAPYGYLAARLYGVHLYRIDTDDEVYERIQEEAERFLHRVHSDDPPTPRDEQDMRRRWLVDDTKTAVVDAGWVANAKQLRALNAQIAEAEKAATALRTLLFGSIADAKFVSFETPAGGAIEVATCGANRMFDVEAFAKTHPDLAARFSKIDRTALREFDKRLYESFMKKCTDITKQTRVLRLSKALDSLVLP